MKKILCRSDLLKRIILSALAVVAVAVMLVGISMAWFANQYQLSSIGKIHPPTYISILKPGDTVMQSIDLSYDKSEVEEEGIVHLKRPIVIRSQTEDYDLCIAHTTNISGLKISLYEALENGNEGEAYLAGITEKGKPYYWNKKSETNLFDASYINKLDGVLLADKTHDAHKETFRLTETESYDYVQKNADPLYWVKDFTGERRNPDDGNFYTNLILEITWDETEKETDILYVVAKTSDKNGSESNQSE